MNPLKQGLRLEGAVPLEDSDPIGKNSESIKTRIETKKNGRRTDRLLFVRIVNPLK